MGDRIEIELVTVDDPPADRPDEHGPTLGDIAQHIHHGYRVAVDHARDYHAAEGLRPGGAPPATTSTRRGGGCDIVRPMLVDPFTASSLAVSPRFLRREHLYLTFVDHDASSERALTWKVVVAGPHLRSVPATLHLLASPSQVVSVLELVPRRRFRWHQHRFVGVGVAAIESLAHEFERFATCLPESTAVSR